VEHVCAVCGSKARTASNFCGPICDLAFRDYFERTFGGPDDAA
jgi:hypothetical protein